MLDSVVIPVSGTQTNIDVDTLRVKDKQIELARGEDSTILDDSRLTKQVLLYKPVAETKNLFGEMATTSWTTNVSLNMTGTAKLKYNGVDPIDGIISAPGITHW